MASFADDDANDIRVDLGDLQKRIQILLIARQISVDPYPEGYVDAVFVGQLRYLSLNAFNGVRPYGMGFAF